MDLSDLERWARGSFLEALLVVLGSILLVRFVYWVADQVRAHSETNVDDDDDELTVSDVRKRKLSVVQVITWSATALIYFVAGLLALERLGVPLTSIVAPATVAGAAIGFGSQSVVKDVLSGFFIFAERQYAYGDVIRVSAPGNETGIEGTVEEVTLRSTRMRTVNGELVILPNGEIRQVTNMSKDWAQVVIDTPFPPGVDVVAADALLHRVGEEIAADEFWGRKLLGPPRVMGLEKFAVEYVQLRIVVRTLPADQWNVARELRGRIVRGAREEGLIIQTPEPA